jgi:hypothetical protein
MTIRESLSRRKRTAVIIMYVGFVLFASVGILSMHNEKLEFLIPIALLPSMAAGVYMLYGIRCPRCRGWIASIIAYGGSPFRVSPKLRFCPFCGVSLDDQCEMTHQT